MAKLSRKEFQEMKKRALTCLRHLILGYYIGTVVDENGCIKMCMGFVQIEVVDVPQVPFRTKNGNQVIIEKRIVVTGNGSECITICHGDVQWLENYIDILKQLVYEIIRSQRNPSEFDREKIKEAYFAVQNIEMVLRKLYPFAEADS